LFVAMGFTTAPPTEETPNNDYDPEQPPNEAMQTGSESGTSNSYGGKYPAKPMITLVGHDLISRLALCVSRAAKQ